MTFQTQDFDDYGDIVPAKKGGEIVWTSDLREWLDELRCELEDGFVYGDMRNVVEQIETLREVL